jgi:hypothetical protein
MVNYDGSVEEVEIMLCRDVSRSIGEFRSSASLDG